MNVKHLMLLEVTESAEGFLTVGTFKLLACVNSDVRLKICFDVEACVTLVALERSLDEMKFSMNFQSFWVLIASSAIRMCAFERFVVLMNVFSVLDEL